MSKVAIADYGMGNLFSVLHACEATGMDAEITSDPVKVREAPGVILPGVGAFGDAMNEIRKRGLFEPLVESAKGGKPFFGVCLGMQLLMETSHEFGTHAGLGLVRGEVVRFADPKTDDDVALKVPQVGWNSIHRPGDRRERWAGTLLEDLPDGAWMYFVHSYVCRPADEAVVASVSRYGQIEFCSSLAAGNLFGCQYHPERSGPEGLEIYRNFAKAIRR